MGYKFYKMKKVILSLVFVFALNLTASPNKVNKLKDPCFDAAIESFEMAEAKYGEFSFEEGIKYLNTAYSNCQVWLTFN
jgi:hypothetical protein